MFAIKINPETDIESSCLTSTGYNWYTCFAGFDSFACYDYSTKETVE